MNKNKVVLKINKRIAYIYSCDHIRNSIKQMWGWASGLLLCQCWKMSII